MPERRLVIPPQPDRRIDVMGVGTPPPLALRPLVGEVLRALEHRRGPAARSTTASQSTGRTDLARSEQALPAGVNRLDAGSLRPRGATIMPIWPSMATLVGPIQGGG